LWIDKDTLDFLNRNREEVKKKANKKMAKRKKGLMVYKIDKEVDHGQFGF